MCNEILYTYDNHGRLTEQTNAIGGKTKYTYDAVGNITSIENALGQTVEYTYDMRDNITSVKNTDGRAVNYNYDVLDELIGKSYDNEEDPQALYGYDKDGNRISMDDVAGKTAYEYDEAGRITAVNLSNGKKILYSYDEYGNISKLTYPDKTAVEYTYNELDQLTQIKDRQGKITKYERDANGNIVKVTRPNNTYTTIEYDDMGNVIKVVNMGKNPYYNIEEELSSFAYTYDKSGFITGEAAKNGRRIEVSQYEYDERAQLVKVNQTVTENNEFVEETQMVYTYDGAGNRLSAVKTSSEEILCNIQYTYNDNSQITDIESDCEDDKQTHIILTYDENGNLKNTTCNDTEKVRDYTYDNENRLKAVKENGSLLMAALYDGNGDRIFRLDYRKNSDYVSNKAGTAENVYYPTSSVNSAYDTDVILNEMLIPNGVTKNTAINYELTGYINDINTEYTQTLMEFGANGNTTNIYEYGAQRNSASINGTKGYYLYDGRGSVASLAGNSGGSMITYRYDAYGNTTKSNNTLNNPYQYNAEYTDSSTGLQYLRARYYDSSQGRFTAKDTYLGTIPNPLSRNQYTYVENNPLNYIDPSGHVPLRSDPMRNMPLISPVDQMKIDQKIANQPFDPLDGIKAATYPGGPQAYYDNKIENVYGEHFFGKGYSNPTGPYRLKTDSSLGYVSNRKEAKTKLQAAIDDRKINLHKRFCENGVDKAKDDGKINNTKINSITDNAQAQFLIDINSEYGQDYLDRASIHVNEYGVVEIKYFDNDGVPYTYYYGSATNLKTMSRQSYNNANKTYHYVTGDDLNKIGDNGLNNPDGSFKGSMWKAMYELAFGDSTNNDWSYSDFASAVDAVLPPQAAIATNTIGGMVLMSDFSSNMNFVDKVNQIPKNKEYAGILIAGY